MTKTFLDAKVFLGIAELFKDSVSKFGLANVVILCDNETYWNCFVQAHIDKV